MASNEQHETPSWQTANEDDLQDEFGKPSQLFPQPPLTPSTVALPTSFWIAVIAIFIQVIAVMTFAGSNSPNLLIVSTLICTTIILGGSLDCVMNSPLTLKSGGIGLTFKIISLCVAVGATVCGLVIFGWVLFQQGLNSEYRVDHEQPLYTPKNIVSGTLQNGLRYTIQKNNFEKGLFSTVLVVDTGSTNEADDQQGLAHFAEHMAFDRSSYFNKRGQVYSEIMRFGADFNAFTNFRNTVYFLHQLPFSVENVKKALFLHKNQVLLQEPIELNVNQEKGAVLGEARLHNSTSRWAVVSLICNHLGKENQACRRFPIGKPEIIANFQPSDFRKYLSDWYRLNRMRLYVVGDFDGQEKSVEKAIIDSFQAEKDIDQNPPTPVPIVPSSKIEPGRVFISEFPNLSGVDLHLMVSREYEVPMSSVDVIRRDTWNNIFEKVFKTQVVARFGSMYPEQLLQGTGITKASVSVEPQWSFNSTVYSLSITTRGKPHRSTWKRDLEVALKELKILAESGPEDDAVSNAMDDLKSDLDDDKSKQKTTAHADVVMNLVGNLDPNFVMIDPDQEYEIVSQFLSVSMIKSAKVHIQTCAQILYRAMLECVANSTYNVPPYDTLTPMVASLSVFHGTSQTKSFLRRITEENIARVVASVHGHAQHPVSSYGLRVMFMIPTFLRARRSNSAQDLRDADFLLNFPQEPKGPQSGTFNLTESSNITGVHKYKLSNGIGVNIRRAADDEVIPRGLAVMQIVALGGLATETQDLKGACQFINTVKANGLSLAKSNLQDESDGSSVCQITHKMDTRVGTNTYNTCLRTDRPSRIHNPDKEPEKKSSREGLGCESEFLRITVTLSHRCDEEEECDPEQKDYTKNLQFGLDEMRPQYDDRTIKLSYQEHEKQLEALELDLTTGDILDRTIFPTLIEQAFPNDPRTSSVVLSDLKALDPLMVNRWVREHFVPGRFEINIAGDLHLDTVLKQVDDIFGVLPLVNFSRTIQDDNITAGILHRVGIDPYDTEDLHLFKRQFNTTKTRLSCTLRSPTPDHAHAFQIVAAGDYHSSRGNVVVRRMADKLISRLAFLSVRRDNGFAYHIEVNPRHSVLFPGFGYYELRWMSGRYSMYAGHPEFSDDLNIVASATVARSIFSKEVSSEVYDEILNTYIQRINSSYVDPEYWVRIMQGLSIKPPTSWGSFNLTSESSLVPLIDTDELTELSDTTLKEKVITYLSTYSSTAESKYLWGIVSTRSSTYRLPALENECTIPVNIV
eukprot:c19822_g1_i1.p1 GENE.c19822_g1_i1~~c19822_g1_i1.p1  ORF type:complete len:1251 (+),score=556.63 c19822_g1_i1:234-3986(+)